MNSTNKNLSIFVVVLMIFTLGLLYNTTTTTSFLTNTKFDADDNNSVNIEQPLKTISFFVNVPVLSLKIYFTFPNCSIKVVL